ncbi:carboxymuconolactone decarboxylase family protein [Bradyrhizobium japonicum]|uniref:carboxymuconolactone decarboxylase family protein n=1 Tax=Bradyrhizobium japonicum TaxID=375 RepID=UPI001BA86FD0|nr:carboxymuconolactone decarboxylase family protein [Bradyrhizobium japonicum]MBR0733178.1 carboxymuconolactone decarboxylase family protein [Bradyrhizobium japonicum]
MTKSILDFSRVRSEVGPYRDDRLSLEERGKGYEDLIGFVPARIAARLNVTGALDSKLLDLQEEIRRHAMYPACFDVKTSQLMLFGMLVMGLLDAASLHARAARKAGASWEEMQAVVSLAYLFGGMPVANRGAEIIAQLAEAEANARDLASEPV